MLTPAHYNSSRAILFGPVLNLFTNSNSEADIMDTGAYNNVCSKILC